MLDLKNCPFCGSSGEELMMFCDPDEGHDNSGPSRRIQCAVCHVEAPFYPSEAEAIAAWNRRALQAVGPEPAVALKPLVEQIDALLAFENPVPPIPNLARSLLASARSALVATPPAEPVVEATARNYVADKETYPRQITFADGRIVRLMTDFANGIHYLEVGSADALAALATKPAIKDDETVITDAMVKAALAFAGMRTTYENREGMRAALAAKEGRS